MRLEDYAELYAIKLLALRAIVVQAKSQPNPEEWLHTTLDLGEGDVDNLLIHNLPPEIDEHVAREKIKAHFQDLIATAMTGIRSAQK